MGGRAGDRQGGVVSGIEEHMGFYTYMWLREDGTPYYVGKGQKRRAFISSAHAVHRPKDRSRIVVFPMLNEAEAFESEIVMIELFGRKDKGTGILHNMTDGGDGSSGTLILTEEVREAKRRAGRIGGKKGGKTQGRIEALTGHGVKNLTREVCARGGHTQGLIQGKKNVESGLLARIRTPEHQKIAGIAAGKKAVESGRIQALGHIQGRKNVESGQIQKLGKTYGPINGRINGRKNAENGRIQALGRIQGKLNASRPEVKEAQVRGRHTRWHASRNIIDPDCSYCHNGEPNAAV